MVLHIQNRSLSFAFLRMGTQRNTSKPSLPVLAPAPPVNHHRRRVEKPTPSHVFVVETEETIREKLYGDGPGKSRRNQTTMEQFVFLSESFQANPKPNQSERMILSQQLGMSMRSIQIWFQNRRMKYKSVFGVLPERGMEIKPFPPSCIPHESRFAPSKSKQAAQKSAAKKNTPVLTLEMSSGSSTSSQTPSPIPQHGSLQPIQPFPEKDHRNSQMEHLLTPPTSAVMQPLTLTTSMMNSELQDVFDAQNRMSLQQIPNGSSFPTQFANPLRTNQSYGLQQQSMLSALPSQPQQNLMLYPQNSLDLMSNSLDMVHSSSLLPGSSLYPSSSLQSTDFNTQHLMYGQPSPLPSSSHMSLPRSFQNEYVTAHGSTMPINFGGMVSYDMDHSLLQTTQNQFQGFM